ncbi:MAG: hypothetical protein JWN04_3516, partial [Myxococcaceae bacterium]|nr:hypothetical protein [Myxococcaceae bacterium]
VHFFSVMRQIPSRRLPERAAPTGTEAGSTRP